MAGKPGQKSAKPTTLPAECEPAFLDALDGRSRIARALHARLAELVTDLGGAERLSYQRASLARRAVFVEARLAHMEGELASGIEVDVVRYTSLLNSLIGLFRLLGLQRHARTVPVLHDYINGRPS